MLSAISVTNAKPKDKPYKLADEKGLYLLVQPTGGRLWRFDYRFNSKRKTLALGKFPDVTLAEAREKLSQARSLLAKHPPIDPSVDRKETKFALSIVAKSTFEDVAREWWESHMANKAESHKDKVIRRFELYLFPWIGKLPISSITPPLLLDTVKRIEKLNKLETAHRALQTAGQVFRYGVQTGRAERDVSADLKGALPPSKVKHMAALIDPKEVSQLLRAMDGFNGTFVVQCAIKLAPLVFVRPGELRHAKWNEINLEESVWEFIASKTKTDHIVPLSKQAKSILLELHPLTGAGEYVFPGVGTTSKPMSESAINSALRRLGYSTSTQITGHGFRAMARTILHERLEISPDILEHQLAHTVVDSLGTAYNRTKFLKQRIETMQIWANYLDEIKSNPKFITK